MTPSQDKLILDYRNYAERIAGQVARDMPISFEDARSCAMIGLCEAAQRFDPAKTTATFKTYSYTRIRGSIIDECRRNSFVRRRGLEKGLRVHFSSLDEPQSFNGEPHPPTLVSRLVDLDASLDFQDALQVLTERERFVILAMGCGYQGRELAGGLGITESRVSQIAAAARSKLERKLKRSVAA